MPSRFLFTLSLLAPLWLSGCVTFERAPADLSCDARLAGRWLPVPNTPEEAAGLTTDDYALVDPHCGVTLSMSQASDKSVHTTQVDARGFVLDDQHYLVLSDADVTKVFTQSLPAGQEPPPALKNRQPTSSATLVRYRIEGDVFSFALIDYETVEALVKEKALIADTADQFNYRISGDAEHLREVLRQHPELFKEDPAKPMRMRRAPTEPRS